MLVGIGVSRKSQKRKLYILGALIFLFGYKLIVELDGFIIRKVKLHSNVLLTILFLSRYAVPFFTIFYFYYHWVSKDFVLYYWAFICTVLFIIMWLVERKLILKLRLKLRYDQKPKGLRLYLQMNPLIHINTLVVWLIFACFSMYSMGYNKAKGKDYFYSYDNGKTLIISLDQDRIISIPNYSIGTFSIIQTKDIGDKKITRVQANK